ncbi:hypothetical protein BKN38_01160 [Helicobacter sp. CLO-3]|uniref:ion transporter n=1 Tax=unclassified Helicobacter TaxID=2593540 RepID=UPI000805C8BB|nr:MULTISPECIES: ion transporter [unclassified Helicobacter]OBV28554.1 hypothetical protein BA723_08995 [Helicobacter sp. CLO-3]OHU85654.1 hypothetical protein BKN38_01160 [Helicobacter sp. CLO-3]
MIKQTQPKLFSNLQNLLNHKITQGLIFAVVVLNALVLGAQTFPSLESSALLQALDSACLYFFVIELALKLFAFRGAFFRSKFNIFDLIVVLVSILPLVGNISVLRFLRVVRILRLFSTFSQIQFVLSVIARSLPSVASIGAILLLLYYVYGVLCVNLFGKDFPAYFGTLGKSFFTLFQIMTLESWSEGVVRPILEVYPYAWIVFVSYILSASFIALNMIVGIIVDSINEIKQKEQGKKK